jgi:predicted nucleotidyltransferase
MAAAEELRSILQAAPEVLLAVLFGSHARGSAGPDSDLDLALRIGAMEPHDLNGLLARLERATATTVDVVLIDSASPLVRFEIARDGVLLVERVPNAWHDLRARAMLDWWEWQWFATRFASSAVERLRSEVARGQA